MINDDEDEEEDGWMDSERRGEEVERTDEKDRGRGRCGRLEEEKTEQHQEGENDDERGERFIKALDRLWKCLYRYYTTLMDANGLNGS